MVSQDQLKEWIESKCPMFWSLLNVKAQRKLPQGIIEYIGEGTPSNIQTGRHNLAAIDRHLTALKLLGGFKAVGDAYRRDLSGVDSETRLRDLFCEIALCASLGNLCGRLKLRPPTGKGTHSDCLFILHNADIYAEAKRLSDPWPHIERPGDESNEKVPYARSITKSRPGEKSPDTARPRSMDLVSKLRDVHRQFPEKNLNMLFVFHYSPGGGSLYPRRYLTQALFGDSSCSENGGKLVLQLDGLFCLKEWRNISACCLASVGPSSYVIFPFGWKNPNALSQIPKPVLDTLCSNVFECITRP